MEKLPWEPTITSTSGDIESDWIAEAGDKCLECGADLHDYMISDGRNFHFCSWDCALNRAVEFPDFYRVKSRGAY